MDNNKRVRPFDQVHRGALMVRLVLPVLFRSAFAGYNYVNLSRFMKVTIILNDFPNNYT